MKFTTCLILSLFSLHAAAASHITHDIETPFSAIDALLKKQVQSALNPIFNSPGCEKYGTSADARPAASRYRCGELAYGSVVSSTQKQILSFNIPAQSGTHDGLDYKVDGVQLSVLLSRAFNLNSTYVVDSLDGNSNKTFSFDSNFLHGLHTRYLPYNDRMYGYSCFSIPGVSLNVPQVKTHIQGTKWVWFVPISIGVDATVNVGSMSFDYAQSCASLRLSLSSALQPKAEILQVEAPRLIGPKFSGMKVTAVASDWFSGLVIWIANAVLGVNIPQQIENAVEKQIISVRESEIKSGQWLGTLFAGTALEKKVVKNAHQSFADFLEQQTPGNPVTLGQDIKKACVAMLGSTAGALIGTICNNLAQVDVIPFKANTPAATAGCFSHQAQLDAPSDRWWKKGCYITTEVIFQVPDIYTPLADCFSQNLLAGPNIVGAAGACQEELQKLLGSTRKNPVFLSGIHK